MGDYVCVGAGGGGDVFCIYIGNKTVEQRTAILTAAQNLSMALGGNATMADCKPCC